MPSPLQFFAPSIHALWPSFVQSAPYPVPRKDVPLSLGARRQLSRFERLFTLPFPRHQVCGAICRISMVSARKQPAKAADFVVAAFPWFAWITPFQVLGNPVIQSFFADCSASASPCQK
jgi:hypothetical protein